MRSCAKYLSAAICLAVGGMAHADWAEPAISEVSHSVDASGRVLTVDYTLSGTNAIVTIDVLTNGVSIGESNLAYFIGDVNRKVGLGARSAQWRVDKGWTGNLGEGVSVKVTAWSLDDPPDYLAVNLSVPTGLTYYVSADAVPYGVTNDLYKTEILLMRRIHAANARFRMGCTVYEQGISGRSTETAHQVTLTNDYYIGVYELTQRQLVLMAKSSTAAANCVPQGDTCPANKYSYNSMRGNSLLWPTDGHDIDASSTLGKLRNHSGLMFDLPTEAQWEFAARAGTCFMLQTGKNIASKSNTDANMLEAAWSLGNSTQVDSAYHPHPVGMKPKNNWGLYDVVGNVWEYCLDRTNGGGTISADEVVEPYGPDRTDTYPVRRGGACNVSYQYNRIASRHWRAPNKTEPDNGYRLWCPVEQQ